MDHRDNQLLDRLTPEGFAALLPHLSTVQLQQGQTLARPGDEIRRVHFPHAGIVSLMVEMSDGDLVQTGMVGRDGVVGAEQALDGRVSINVITVQLPGSASVIDRDRLREAVRSDSSLRTLLATQVQFLISDIQQTAACNALHAVEQRMCRWLLRMNDLVGPDIVITQEFFAAMIGVRRTSVNSVAMNLQAKGIISYNRGLIHISNAGLLEASSCECHSAVQHNRRILFKA